MRARSSTARALAISALVAIFVAVASAGCAANHPPLLGSEYESDEDAGAIGDDGGGGSILNFDSGPPPGCGVGPDGGVCGCVDLPVVGDPPNLYFVLDRSGSMVDLDKWLTVRTVVAKVVDTLGGRAKFGAAVFPNPSAVDQCSVGIEVMSVRPGGDAAAVAVLNATATPADGGTPTAATLVSLTSKVMALPGKTFVIVATDGGPNCNSAANCDVSQCIPNIENSPMCAPNEAPNCCLSPDYGPTSCLDAQPTIDAVAALKAGGIPTYVIGVPGSGPYAGVLDQMATAGGTARPTSPFYYNVDTADSAAFQKALAQIAAKIVATCTLPLGPKPPDPGLVNVYLDGKVIAPDPVNGWKITGSTVTLLGTTCQSVLVGSVLDVRVIAGCPTVVF